MKKKTELYRTDWNGVLLEIVYDPLWCQPTSPARISPILKYAAFIQRRSRCRSQRPDSTPTPCRHGSSPPPAAPSPSSTS